MGCGGICCDWNRSVTGNLWRRVEVLFFDHAYADRCDSGTGNIIRRSSNTLQRGNFSGIAGILFWLSFLGLITTISDNLFWDADTGIFLAVMVWFESIIWMVILGIRAIVLKIKNRR